jgi:hypothetical protein
VQHVTLAGTRTESVVIGLATTGGLDGDSHDPEVQAV